jgi:hypothetical protein
VGSGERRVGGGHGPQSAEFLAEATATAAVPVRASASASASMPAFGFVLRFIHISLAQPNAVCCNSTSTITSTTC